MEKTQIYIPEWLSLSRETREVLIGMFSLQRDIATEVAANQVVCDGFSNQMLSYITIDAMRALGYQGKDFLEVFHNMIHSIENPEPITTVSEGPAITVDAVNTDEPVVIHSPIYEAPKKVIKKVINKTKK